MPELLEYIPQKERDSYDADDFAGPDRSFPITTQAQLDAAAHLIGHADNPEAVKRKAIAIAKRKGFTLPKAWQDDEKKQEDAASATITYSSYARPRSKIATLRVCFLEYNARSLNGRIYPKATCDRIYASAIKKLADPNALPVTCFVSHEAANGNVNTELVGRAVKIWQEGGKFYADLDLADTRTAWDMLALTEGGYMRSESMRVLGVELLHDRNYDVPLVVIQEGVEPELLGIDLTTRPGLMDTARIQQVLYEQKAIEPFTESFSIDSVSIQSKEEAPMSHIPLYLKVLADSAITEAMTADRAAHQRIHDHLAGVLDDTVKAVHGSESARLVAAVESELSEEGRALAAKHAKRLAAAHDEAAHQSGMDCEGAYNSALGIPDATIFAPSDTDNDGDDPAHGFDPDNDGESLRRKGKTSMELTEEEMIAVLKAKGFAVEAPKTSEQLLQESFDAKLAAQKQEFDEKFKQFTESAPQRKTLSAGGLNEGGLTPEPLYQEGDYLAGTLAPTNWKALANRRVPWPQDMDPNQALHELAPFLAYRLLDQEANAMGREVTSFVDAHERV